MFGLVDGMFLRPLPVRDPNGLVWVSTRTTEGDTGGLAWLDYLEVKDAVPAFSDLAVQSRRGGQIDDPSDPELVLVTVVSDNYFPLLGVSAARGRLFDATLDVPGSGEPAIAISDSLWRRRFGADPPLIGRPLSMNGRAFTVVGILPPAFRGLDREIRTDVWVPVATWKIMGNRREFEERSTGQFEALGRLRPDASVAQARAQLETVTARFQQSGSEAYRGRRLVASTEAERQCGRDGQRLAPLLLGIVGLVVVIACANVAMLQLAQIEGRRREIGIRLAIGAGRWQLVRLFLTEGAMLAVAGTAAGLLLARWLIPLLPRLLPPGPSFVEFNARMDARVVAVTLAGCLVAIFVVGLVPALQAARTDLVSVMKTAGAETRRRFWGSHALVGAHTALSVVLIVAAGLLARSFFNTLRRPLGFDTSKPVLTLFVIDKGPGNRVYAGVEEMAARLRALPGVTRAAYCRRTAFSGSGDGATRDVSIPSRVAALGMELLRLRYNQVSVDFLAVSGTRLLAGRGFTPADMDSGARVVLVNQTMANRFWPDRSPIGHSILVDQHATTVVGVVEDTVISQVHEAPEPFMVLPFGQMPTGELTFLLQTAGPPEAVLGPARRELSQSGSLVLVQATTLAQ